MLSNYVYFEKLDPRAELPTRGTPNSVGLDLYTLEDVIVGPRALARLRTGIRYASAPQSNYAAALVEAQVRMRSSTFERFGLVMPNAPGTIDPDYTGEFLIQVVNLRDMAVEIPAKTRLAQLVFSLVPIVEAKEGQFDARIERDGFGSTGH